MHWLTHANNMRRCTISTLHSCAHTHTPSCSWYIWEWGGQCSHLRAAYRIHQSCLKWRSVAQRGSSMSTFSLWFGPTSTFINKKVKLLSGHKTNSSFDQSSCQDWQQQPHTSAHLHVQFEMPPRPPNASGWHLTFTVTSQASQWVFACERYKLPKPTALKIASKPYSLLNIESHYFLCVRRSSVLAHSQSLTRRCVSTLRCTCCFVLVQIVGI